MNEDIGCDRCCARAVHIYRTPTPEMKLLELAFCNHHSKKHSAALDEQGWTVEVLVEGAST